MTHAEDILLTALVFKGHRYRFGGELDPKLPPDDDDEPDCSELVQYSCERNHVEMVDGAANQFAFCKAKGTEISVSEALRRRCALMFITEANGRIGHVVFSVPPGSTMEAKGHDYGCGVFSAFKRDGRTPRFDKAALIPGVDYSPGHEPLPPLPASSGRPILKQGATGAYVTVWQQLLHDHGAPHLVVDGQFGARTTSATAAFQVDHGLVVDGKVGEKSWAKMLDLTGRVH